MTWPEAIAKYKAGYIGQIQLNAAAAAARKELGLPPVPEKWIVRAK